MSASHDVIVVGAGPAGSATAYFLAQRGARVLLLDKSEFPRDKTCGDALSPRALRVIEKMDLLERLTADSFCVHNLHLYAPNGKHAVAPVPREPGMPDYALVTPRLKLDALLQEQAIAAGAEFRGNQRVVDVIRAGRQIVGVRARARTGELEYRARGVVLATGVAARLQEKAGLIRSGPTLHRAARAYFDNVADLSDQIEFYFNHVRLPGYGWMFPTGPATANIGIGYIGDGYASPQAAFDDLLARHSRLLDILSQAEQIGPTRSFPLRADFHRSRCSTPGLLAIGEAVGLVNPFTGEGIDYALESGELAADTVSSLLGEGLPWTSANLAPYTRALRRRFRKLFIVMTLGQHIYYRRTVLNRIFGSERKMLLKTLVDISFSNADPALAFSPRTLFEIVRP